MAQKLENRANLFRIQILIIDGGLLALRNKIDQTLTAQGITLSACLNNEKKLIYSLKSSRIITQVQYDILFPTSGPVPTTSDMDITLIICLLRSLKLFGLNKKFDWNATPLFTDKSVEADICRLKAYRNEISHIAETTAIQANDFATWRNDIEQILVRLSSPPLNIQQNIADFKDCPLDPDEEKRVQEEIKKWKDYEADVDRLKEEMTDVKERVTEVENKQELIYRRLNEGVSSMQTEEEKYKKRKKELKDGLITFYKTRHSKVFLSPLFEEKDTPLVSFYVRPDLSSIDSTTTKSEDRLPVKSLSEIFKTENKQNLEIYVLADAGIGKTAFSKYLANVWCQAHCHDEDMNKSLLKNDIECMHEFDFLFLVLLRDADDLCSIDELIFEKIVSNLGLKETLSKDALLEILNNEKCVVILDGLDEWTHPEEKSDKKCYRSPKSIPHRNDREKCTVLTTTRPWKLGVLGLDSCQLGKKVELTKLSYDSAFTLTERILQRWKSSRNKDALQIEVTQFIKTISWRHNAELAFVPLLLIYITCLWCDGVQIESSNCDIYINIVELLLSRTIKIHGELQQSHELSSSDIPECFAEYDNCTKYYPLLMHLGKLAYLFCILVK
ncbi:uncharacterized protein LOC132760615 [Ruditapes philippinarum]|uniref:uncharacterized protein LOC132760615 n=1 Tax=Ruditapes philippinarum TaxID=129788 RepID=UPI00295A7839|nr:uncharacterized protein LOC132760615 [Ruditapes philippinarum]